MANQTQTQGLEVALFVDETNHSHLLSCELAGRNYDAYRRQGSYREGSVLERGAIMREETEGLETVNMTHGFPFTIHSPVLDEKTSAKTRKAARRKSSMSYVGLISSAILSSPEKRLTLSEIYIAIEKKFPEFTSTRAGWKNTVRHNLSLHECFVKGELASNGKSSYWRVQEDFEERFKRGQFNRHAQVKKPQQAKEPNTPPKFSIESFLDKEGKEEWKLEKPALVTPFPPSPVGAGWPASNPLWFASLEYFNFTYENNASSSLARVFNACPCCSAGPKTRADISLGEFSKWKLPHAPTTLLSACPYLPKAPFVM